MTPPQLLQLACRAALLVVALAQPLSAQGSLTVPAPDAPVSQSLPPRALPDPLLPLDVTAAVTTTFDLYAHFRSAEPPLDERVLALGLDPAQAFALIRDQVASQPYDGHLRDPGGVFAAGSGNAYDKALALAELLSRMGYDTRLVAGPLPSPTPSNSLCGGGTVSAETWRLTGLGPDVLTRVPLRAAASYVVLHGHLTPADQPGAHSTQPHIWLQMRDGADWLDLDPWLPDTGYGDHPQGQGTLLDTPPENHAVTVTLQVETLRDGQLERTDILTERLDLPLAARSLVALAIGPQATGVGGTVADVLAGLDGAAAQMVASLMVNGDTHTSRPFAAPGLAAVADDFLSDGAEIAELTTALLLIITSHAPGRPDHAETRTIIDLIAPETRLAAPAEIDPASLLPVTGGDRMPAALEGLRQIVISHGGTSRRITAALAADQILNLGGVLERARAGLADPWDMIWGSWLEANRIQLAAEELIRARPAHQGACMVIDRPRVLIWGITGTGDDDVLRWLDWAIDDVSVQGGNAAAQAEARLWHGTLQAALEKEALLRLVGAPDSLIPLDAAPMQPLGRERLAAIGQEGAEDTARGYLTLADAAMPADQWWRLNPASGHSDARGRFRGNIFWLEWGAELASIARQGEVTATVISEAEQAYINARTGPQLVAEIEREMAALEAAAAQPKCGGNEYLIIGTCVSIPISVGTGVGVVLSVVAALAYATY